MMKIDQVSLHCISSILSPALPESPRCIVIMRARALVTTARRRRARRGCVAFVALIPDRPDWARRPRPAAHHGDHAAVRAHGAREPEHGR
jgi:hypothetical protein